MSPQPQTGDTLLQYTPFATIARLPVVQFTPRHRSYLTWKILTGQMPLRLQLSAANNSIGALGVYAIGAINSLPGSFLEGVYVESQ